MLYPEFFLGIPFCLTQMLGYMFFVLFYNLLATNATNEVQLHPINLNTGCLLESIPGKYEATQAYL